MENIPLFPLHRVLYPHGILPLTVFEPRYVDMVSECMKTNSGFGVCLIQRGTEVGPAASCFHIGTYARIIDFSQQQNALLRIDVQGQSRFRVLSTAVRDNHLLTGDIDWIVDEKGLPCPEEFASLQAIYLHLMKRYESLYPDEPHDGVDSSILAYRLAEFLPLDEKVRQAILEEDSISQRLELIAASLPDPRGRLDAA